MVTTQRAKVTMLDHQGPTMTDSPRIVIYEDDNVIFDTSDPGTYTILDNPEDLLAPLRENLTDRLERDLAEATR